MKTTSPNVGGRSSHFRSQNRSKCRTRLINTVAMNPIRNLFLLYLLPLLWAATSCQKIEADVVHAISGKHIPVADGVTAFGGDLDGIFSFMIIPTEAGQPKLVGQAFGGLGYTWNGLISFQNQKRVDFEAKCDKKAKEGTIVIGDSEFDLGKGEVFCVASNSTVKQILGSKAGKTNDPGNANRLAEIYGDETSEQAAPSDGGMPPK
jgi:hypothetical protein